MKLIDAILIIGIILQAILIVACGALIWQYLTH